ncbi:hypothetical protein DY78_GL000909 [Lactiplantibacillus fabifermentans DSM 21115]|uniref:Uncharacterized protein n=1 Tax=Lactiplantibacillus fabifermentans DSM 21115 TaxID=1413187 RepID=A0A0R2NL27_9LACO|nr:hypothetical protein DY78_GL000909 [Lactiplantibacillus fabifermentans DSM 21115]
MSLRRCCLAGLGDTFSVALTVSSKAINLSSTTPIMASNISGVTSDPAGTSPITLASCNSPKIATNWSRLDLSNRIVFFFQTKLYLLASARILVPSMNETSLINPCCSKNTVKLPRLLSVNFANSSEILKRQIVRYEGTWSAINQPAGLFSRANFSIRRLLKMPYV